MAKQTRAKKTATPAPADPAAAPVELTPPVDPPPAVRGSKVPGILDSRLHPSLHEAHRVLVVGQDAFAKVLDHVEGQFVRPLLNAHDGDSAACAEIQEQIAAFRGLYK